MTHVLNLFGNKGQTMSLDRALNEIKHGRGHKRHNAIDIPRDKIMTVRRLARKGESASAIMKAIGYQGGEPCFRQKCKKLQINLHTQIRRWLNSAGGQ